MTAIDVRERTIFGLPRGREPGASTTTDWLSLVALAVAAWVGAMAFVGQYRRNQVARMLYVLASADVLFWGSLAAALVMAACALALRRRALAGAALVVAAFLAGHVVHAWSFPLVRTRFAVPFQTTGDGLRFAAGRLVYGLALTLPMLAAWFVAFGRGGWPPLALGWGDLRVRTRDVSAKTPPAVAWRSLIGGYALFCLVLLLMLQASLRFQPLRGGRLWPLLPALLLASLANAAAEELVFRGFLQPALIRAGGLTAGLWVQGFLFGLMHWGASVGVLAALPTSLLIGLGSVAWGKYALDTRGLGWVFLAHAMIDIAVMSAYFVPRT